jgi:prepilin-type processing-associated H-X9-DG protein
MTAAAQEADPVAAELFGLLRSLQKPQTSYAVTVNMPDALVSVGRTNFNLVQTMMLQVAAMPMGLMGGMVVPALSRARTQARQVSDMANLKQLSLGLIMYADEHNVYPQSLADIWEKGYVDMPGVFVSPAGQTPAPQSAQQVREGQCDYIYLVPGARFSDFDNVSTTPILCTRPGLLAQGVNVAYADGHVERRTVIDPELQTLINTRSRE